VGRLRVILEIGPKRRVAAGAIRRTAQHAMDHALEIDYRTVG
jgi:hypothetical protein